MDKTIENLKEDLGTSLDMLEEILSILDKSPSIPLGGFSGQQCGCGLRLHRVTLRDGQICEWIEKLRTLRQN